MATTAFETDKPVNNNQLDQRSMIDNQEERLKDLEFDIDELFEPINNQRSFMRFKFQKKKYKFTAYGLEHDTDDQDYLQKLKVESVMSVMEK